MENVNRSSPFVSEKCVNLGVAPQLGPHSGHVHQLGEVQFALGLPAEEPGPQQGRPFQLQHLLAAAPVWLQGEHSQMLLRLFLQRTKVLLGALYHKWLEIVLKSASAPLQLVILLSRFTLATKRPALLLLLFKIFYFVRYGKRCQTVKDSEQIQSHAVQCSAVSREAKFSRCFRGCSFPLRCVKAALCWWSLLSAQHNEKLVAVFFHSSDMFHNAQKNKWGAFGRPRHENQRV